MAEKRKITIHPSFLGDKPTSLVAVEKEPEVEKEEKQSLRDESLKAGIETKISKKSCYFCQSKTSPAYTDLATLRKYLTDRAKIVAKLRSGVCSKHQRAVAKNIKYARHLDLLPFTPKV